MFGPKKSLLLRTRCNLLGRLLGLLGEKDGLGVCGPKKSLLLRTRGNLLGRQASGSSWGEGLTGCSRVQPKEDYSLQPSPAPHNRRSAKRHRKMLRDNIQGITKPAIRRLSSGSWNSSSGRRSGGMVSSAGGTDWVGWPQAAGPSGLPPRAAGQTVWPPWAAGLT